MEPKKYLGKILLISPSFFSYHILIKNEMENQGYFVDWVDDRAGVGFLGKSLLRLFPILFTKFLEDKFINIFDNFEEDKYDHILVIKGEGLSLGALSFLKKKFNKASLGFYLWDGVRNAKNAVNISHFFDVVSTFDIEDSRKNGWHYRPLFCKKINNTVNEYDGGEMVDISFIGTLHSDRHRIVKKIFEKNSQKYNLFFYLYVQNFIMKLYRSIFDISILFSNIGFVKYKPIEFNDYNNIKNNSKSVLDIEHPAQNGFTMRTIETLISGKKLITTNKNIINSNIYHPSRILLIDRKCPEISDDFMSSKFLELNNELIDYYSINFWISELIELQEKNKSL